MEDISIEPLKTEKEREQKTEKWKKIFKDSRSRNVHGMGTSDKRKKGTEIIFEMIIIKDFPNLTSDTKSHI